jgi:hypothetical protein
VVWLAAVPGYPPISIDGLPTGYSHHAIPFAEAAVCYFEVAAIGNVTTGSLTDRLSRMMLDEAHLILNTKREEGIEQILKVCPLGLGLLPLHANSL